METQAKTETSIKFLMSKEQFTLLDKCRADVKDLREILMYVHIRSDYALEATNGRILIRFSSDVIDLKDKAPGCYKILSVEKGAMQLITAISQVDAQFPKTDQVIPEKTKDTLDILLQKKKVHALSIVRIYNWNKAVISEKFLDILGELNQTWTLSKSEKEGTAQRFETQDGNIIAVVMPIQPLK